MKQTPNTKLALERDKYRCQWCLHKNSIRRGVFQGPLGTSALGGGHHIFGRRNADEVEAIVGLCSEHHSDAEAGKISTCDLMDLMKEITGVDIKTKYPQFHKCHGE